MTVPPSARVALWWSIATPNGRFGIRSATVITYINVLLDDVAAAVTAPGPCDDCATPIGVLAHAAARTARDHLSEQLRVPKAWWEIATPTPVAIDEQDLDKPVDVVIVHHDAARCRALRDHLTWPRQRRLSSRTSNEGEHPVQHDNIGKQLNLDTVTIAGVYAASLGSSASFAKDREALTQLLEVFPGQIDYAWNNRGFLRRAVVEMCDRGIEQFLDIGSGLPVVGNVHEVARKCNPDARVAYVDIDAVAVHHARELLEMNGGSPRGVTSSDVDMRDPDRVLNAPGVVELIDFSEPVGLLMLGILDIIDTRETLDTASLVAMYRDACAPGSMLAISNAGQQDMSDETLAAILAMGAQTSTPVVSYRSAEQVEAFFDGYQLLDPGIVPTAAWRPDKPVSDQEAAKSNAWAGVGVLPC